MTLTKCTLTVVFLVSLLSGAGAPQDKTVTGSIQGVLLDRDSKPLSGATVYALPLEDMRKPVASSTTDSVGQFSLPDLPAGVILIMAYKESDGYPNSLSAFFSPDGHPPASLTLGVGQVVIGLTVKLGARAAYLKFNITDENGNRLNAGLRFTRDDQPGQYYGTAILGDEAMMVPSMPFRLTVEAEGYEPWHYGGANYTAKAGLITLKSGQTFNLAVRLRKK
jgi:hypothetical protein